MSVARRYKELGATLDVVAQLDEIPLFVQNDKNFDYKELGY